MPPSGRDGKKHPDLYFTRANNPFPQGFVEETLQTLAILFPKGDRDVERWYKKKGRVEELDFRVLKGGSPVRRIENYRYWRDRLVQLKDTFDDSRPRTWKQQWYDRRETTQWWALWVAVGLTLLFGLVQSIEGAIQVYVSLNPSHSSA